MTFHYRTALFYYKDAHDHGEINWSIHEAPFRSDTWYVCGMSMIGCGLVFLFTVKVGPLFEEDINVFNISAIIMILVHGALNQSTADIPKKGSSQTVFCIIYAIGLMVWTSYAAVLTSVLAIHNFFFFFFFFGSSRPGASPRAAAFATTTATCWGLCT